MKKYLLTFCLLALVQVAFGFEQDTLSSKDSVIVEFGSSGKIIMIVDNKEDFERLKMMDVNQIIRELDLELDYESGETTIVELKHKDGAKEIVKIHEDGPTTKVYVGRWRVIVDDTGNKTQVKVESGPKKKKEDPDFRTYFNMDLGVNNYFENKAVPGERAVHGVKGWGSWNVGLNWMASQKLRKGSYWDFGIGVQWYNFKLDNRNYQIISGDEGIEFINRTDVNGFKSKMSASYLTALTLFRWDFGKMNDSGRDGLRVAIGPYAGYRLGGRSKFVYRELGGSGRKKEKEPIGADLNNFRYGLRGEIGFRSVTFFTTYDFNTLIQKDRGPVLHPIAFGLVF
ncbi:MAG TPA: hypothetical protein VK014_14375 [Cyclobacteriaceae bacterium]|nr:hypothetical protein [Cyclobacteriaceae bacterium]